MSNVFTRNLDKFVERISGPNLQQRLEELQKDNASFSDNNDADSKSGGLQVQATEVLTDSEDIDEVAYLQSFFLFKFKPVAKYIRSTYHPLDKSVTDAERFYLFKLDMFLMTWACFSNCIKSIDQGNYANAYVSGMKEELNFVGKQYNWLQSYFTIGYAIMIIPSQIIITLIKPNIWLPSAELIWGILTACCGAKGITSAPQMFPLRFFIGLLEASSWPGATVMFMNWYGSNEISSRSGGYAVSGVVGNMFTGFMQAAITKTLNGRLGLSGWRWMFIINGIMTIIIALFGYIILPNIPEKGGAAWLNEGDLKIARMRSKKFKKKSLATFRLKDLYRAIFNYKIWAFVLSFVPWTWANFGLSYMNLWLKSLKNIDGTNKFSVYQINMIPIGGYAISLVTLLFWSKLADIYTHRRFFIILLNQLIGVLGCSILAAWPKSDAFKFVGFFIMFQMNVTGPICVSLLGDLFRTDPVLRSITIGITVTFVYAMDTWYPLYIWPSTEAPHYTYGWNVSVGFEVFSLISVSAFFLIYKRHLIKIAESEHLA